MKATHQGTCQVCGAAQKLPNNKLSLHGYTVEHSFFEGVCRGAKHLPFELDKALIEGAIKAALAVKADIEANIEKYTNSTESKAWFHVWVKYPTYSRMRSHYQWQYLAVIPETKEYPAGVGLNGEAYPAWWSHNYTREGGDNSNRQSATEYGKASSSPEFPMPAVVKARNADYIKLHLQPKLKQVTQYIRWQRERIENWMPHPEKLVDLSKSKAEISAQRVTDAIRDL